MRSKTWYVIRRAELMVQEFLVDTGATNVVVPAIDSGIDYLAFYSNEFGGTNIVAVELKATETSPESGYRVRTDQLRKLQGMNVPSLLIVADVKKSDLYFAWIPETLREEPLPDKGRPMRVSVERITDSVKSYLAQIFTGKSSSVLCNSAPYSTPVSAFWKRPVSQLSHHALLGLQGTHNISEDGGVEQGDEDYVFKSSKCNISIKGLRDNFGTCFIVPTQAYPSGIENRQKFENVLNCITAGDFSYPAGKGTKSLNVESGNASKTATIVKLDFGHKSYHGNMFGARIGSFYVIFNLNSINAGTTVIYVVGYAESDTNSELLNGLDRMLKKK